MGWPSRKVGWIGAVTQYYQDMNYLDILLHKTEDGGETWRAMKNMPPGSPAGICGLYAVTESLMYGAGTNDPNLPGTGVVKTSDGGATWQFIYLSHLANNLIDCYSAIRTPVGSLAASSIRPARHRRLEPVTASTPS